MSIRSWIVDRRIDNPNRSVTNKERFMRRYKSQIQRSINDAVNKRSIKDLVQDTEVPIERKSIEEPSFHHSGDGVYDRVLSGNDQFQTGDRHKKPSGGGGGKGGSGSGEASDDGSGEDEFRFVLSKEEFLRMFFDDMELPNLERSVFAQIEEHRSVRAGYTTSGSPANLAIPVTLKHALGRELAMHAVFEETIREIIEKLEHEPENLDLLTELQEVRRQQEAVLAFEDRDLRYRARKQESIPTSRAVMFCLMDVSGSMAEHHKELAKRFFILLYMFLEANYEHIEVVFIRHTNSADEVDEQTFFYGTATGGTIVMSGLSRIEEIIKERYADGTWNTYIAQASDGDAFGNDGEESAKFIRHNLLPRVQYFAYIEVASEESHRNHTAVNSTSLWKSYEASLSNRDDFSMRRVQRKNEIHPALRDLFRKKKETT